MIQHKLCSLIIDESSCTNVSSIHLVSKLKLPNVPHTWPYSLHWLKKGNEVRVTKQALIACTIGNFRDEVICNILPLDASQFITWEAMAI